MAALLSTNLPMKAAENWISCNLVLIPAGVPRGLGAGPQGSSQHRRWHCEELHGGLRRLRPWLKAVRWRVSWGLSKFECWVQDWRTPREFLRESWNAPGPSGLWHFIRTREISSRRQLKTSAPRQLMGQAGPVEVWGCSVSHIGIFRPTALLPEVRVLLCRTAAALAAVFSFFPEVHGRSQVHGHTPWRRSAVQFQRKQSCPEQTERSQEGAPSGETEQREQQRKFQRSFLCFPSVKNPGVRTRRK